MSDVLVRLITELPPERRAYLVDLLQPAPEPVAIVGLACRFRLRHRHARVFPAFSDWVPPVELRLAAETVLV